MKNICIVGYGSVGPFHARALDETKNANFYAVCDIKPEKIQLCKETYDVKGYMDYSEMLSDTSIDCVHICTPHYLHYDMICSALKARKTVVAEKPIAMTKKEFELLLHTPGIEDVCIVFQNRLNSCVKTLKKIIDSKELGNLICSRGILTWIRSKSYYTESGWRGKLATEGGGVLINQAVHTLDLLSYLGGTIESVSANTTNFSLKDTIETEDTVTAYLKYKSGATGLLFATNAYRYHPTPELEFVFENGIARYNNDTLYIDNKIVCQDRTATGEKSYYGMGHGILCREFYDENKHFNIYDAENTMRTLFAIYESAKTNHEIII